MASLTPGVLSKLLKHANDRDFKVTGEHRSALLQVIEIVPSLPGGDDDPWKSRGFFLKVSDSLHSTYVSISNEDVDLIFSDKIQLGQFVHVSRLDSATPLPILRGVKPVPKRRACVGNPTDLTPTESLPFRLNVNLKMARKDSRNLKKDAVKKLDLKLNVKRSKFEDVRSRRASIDNARGIETEVRRLSLDSVRRGWEMSPRSNIGVRSSISSDSTPVISGKACPRKESPLKHRSSTSSPLKSKSSLTISPMESKSSYPSVIGESLKGDMKSSKECISHKNLVEVPLNIKNYDQIIPWDSLPSNIHDLGKDTLQHKEAAFLGAVDALHDASAANSVIRCMSMFAELSESAQQDAPGFLVEKFLDLHQNMELAGSVVEALLKTRSVQANAGNVTMSQIPSLEICKRFSDKNADATLWAQAAVETELSRFSVFSKQDKKGNQQRSRNYIVLEIPPEITESQDKNWSPQKGKSPKNQGLLLSDKKGQSLKRRVGVSPRRSAKDEKVEWSKGRGLDAVASLAEKLLSASREWFLKYLEDSLIDGFRSKLSDGGNDIASLLGQLKRVNQWLEDAVGNKLEVDERVQSLRQKLYCFLLEHVDSSIASR